MEETTGRAVELIEQRLFPLCHKQRKWEIKEEKFLALKPLEASRKESLEEKLESGVIVIDKPPGPTSHEVVAYLKKMLGLKRAGHGGTLEG